MPTRMTPPKKKSNRISLNNSQSQSVRYIVNELKKAGFDQYSIAGILGNAMQESSITPGLAGNNYSGTWQNHRTLANQIRQLYGGHDLQHQVRYLIDWVNGAQRLKNEKYSGTAGYMAGKFKKSGYKSAQEASDAFLKLYERAIKKGTKGGDITNYQEWDKRRAYSDQMYEYLYGSQPQQSVQKQPQRTVQPTQRQTVQAPRTSVSDFDRQVVRFVPPPGVPQQATSPYLMLNGDAARRKTQMPTIQQLHQLAQEEQRKIFQPAFSEPVQPPYVSQPSYARGKNTFPFWNRFGNTMSLRRY